MKNASRTARYMMMARSRGGENYRNEYNVGDINYSVDNRFRDRRGREHYNNGRFAPMRNEYEMNYRMERGGQDYRNEYDGDTEDRMAGRGNSYGESRRGTRYAYDDDEDMEMRGRMIGFGDREAANGYYPTPWYNEAGSNYGGRMENHHGMEMERHGGEAGMGRIESKEMKLTPEKARKWVENMSNEEGKTGEHWGVEQVKALMSQKSIDYDPYEVYAIMNALYSDYGKVFKRREITAPELYLELAMAWLKDKDAVKNKAAAYYEYIVKH